MVLEDMQIRDSLFMKLRSQQRTRIRPNGSVDIEYSVSKKLSLVALRDVEVNGDYKFPGFVEVFAFTEVAELGCKDSFDVLRINSHDRSLTWNPHLPQSLVLTERDTMKVVLPVIPMFLHTSSKFSYRLEV